jgi:hypothetical protein
MGEKLVIGPFNQGLRNDVTAFNIDNDSFPTLINAYQWRGRVKRKHGTQLLNRLTRFFNSLSTAYNAGSTTITLNGSGVGNLITGFSLETNASIVPGSVTITAPGPTVYTDPDEDGTLSPSGSINYSTGVITIAAEAGSAVSAVFRYFPALPVMGLEDFDRQSTLYAETIAFDTKRAYAILQGHPYNIYNVSYYKNPPTGTYTGYTQKSVITPLVWNGLDYQQFWTVNYQNALWATNGVPTPFTTTNIGMQFKLITGVSIVTAGNGTTIPAVADLTIAAHGLVVGDFVFINEVLGITGINFQTGYVTTVVGVNTVRVTFQNAILGGAYTSGGIAQYLTNTADATVDCIRFYDGDPTDGDALSPTLNGDLGWVNFCPPLSQNAYSIADLPQAIYYLAGAKLIMPFKDRILFIGPVVQTSSGVKHYLQDTIIYSQNGTPYYTSSFNGDVVDSRTNFFEMLTPERQTGQASTFFEDQTGFGGFTEAGVQQPIMTVGKNGDVLILGFLSLQAKLIYTSDDISPFNFFIINSELGSNSTFSVINTDEAVMTRGSRGFIVTNQSQCARFDLIIPNEVFEIKLSDNGAERMSSQRDYLNEWIYFTYPSNQRSYKFPNQTLQYNYRDESWGIFYETYTTYGLFRRATGYTWATLNIPSWSDWNTHWNSGQTTLNNPEVIAGNQQGFIVFRDETGDEAFSLYIQDIVGDIVTSPDHTLDDENFIYIDGALGTADIQVNKRVFQIQVIDDDSFQIFPEPGQPAINVTEYLGGATLKRYSIPYIQTKQFPTSWGLGRKTRLGVQQYLLSTTDDGQIQLLIFLSQNDDSPYNTGGVIPAVTNNSTLIYSTVLYTCPESTNLGLTPANTNLQMPTAVSQQQIWHRVNTSLLGDTVQLGFSLSQEQMFSVSPQGETLTITDITQANPAVATVSEEMAVGTLVLIEDVQGMYQLNGLYFLVTASTPTTATLGVDSTGFDAYTEGGTMVAVAPENQTEEIELHGFILDVTPSQMLS